MRKKIRSYRHKVQYYETDQMQVVHHSNYIRWFEEARVDFMEQIGLPYKEMEEKGIVCPVIEISAKYMRMVKFGDTVRVRIKVEVYNGIKLILSYQVISTETKLVHCTGESQHCFLSEKGKPVFLKKEHATIHEMFATYATHAKKKKEEKRNED